MYPEESFAKVKKYGLPMLLTQDEGVKSFIANLNAQLSGKNRFNFCNLNSSPAIAVMLASVDNAVLGIVLRSICAHWVAKRECWTVSSMVRPRGLICYVKKAYFFVSKLDS